MPAGGGDGLEVRGGCGGVDARLEDLVAAAALLRRCGRDLAVTAALLGRLVSDPGMQVTGLLAPGTLAGVDTRAAAAVAGPHGLILAAVRLEALGAALGVVAAGYRAADAAADGAVHELELAGGAAAARLFGVPLLVGAAGFGAGVVLGSAMGADEAAGSGQGKGSGQEAASGQAVGSGRAAGRWLLDLLGQHGDLAEHVVAAVPGYLDGMVLPTALLPSTAVLAGVGLPLHDVPRVATLVGTWGAVVPGLREPARVQVTLQQGHQTPPPGGLADLVDRVVSCYPPEPAGVPSAVGTAHRAGAGSGRPSQPEQPARVRVDQVIGPGGRRAWVVAVPGQQEMSLRGGTNPFDLAGDVHAMARQDTAAREGTLAAMEAAGIPPGEPVLIAGHSQGGMVAASLAADPKVRTRFHITHVLTVGSPVAEFPVPADVQVLSVEHTDDPVPRLDGRPDPDRAGWVTVRRTVHDPGAPTDALRAHDLDEYRRTLALADRSDDPSLRAYRAGLEPFLGRPGAVGWSNDVTVSRATG